MVPKAVLPSLCYGMVALVAGCSPLTGRPAAPPDLITLQDNGGWCWFQGDRVVVDRARGRILASTVANARGAGGSTRHGSVELACYDIATRAVTRITLHDRLEADDHNSAALLVLSDGRYLAMYSKHHTDTLSRYRLTSSPGGADWGREAVHDNVERTTYSNLLALTAENDGRGRLYNFTRTVGYDPNFLVSDDGGTTWRYGGRLLDGPGRPYVRYASDGGRAIHLIATEQHPRDFPNCIYHGYVRDGRLHRSDGVVVDPDVGDAAGVSPDALTPVFRSDGVARAWTIDIQLDNDGRPYIAFSVRARPNPPADPSGWERRYYYGRFDGTAWAVSPMAYAGDGLYPAETDYTGLVALHPHDPSTAYISADVHPATGEPLVSRSDRRRHYEIFRGVTADGGRSWAWDPITADSTSDNIRPVVPRWEGGATALFWLRGTYTSYKDYDLQVVGTLNPTPVSPDPGFPWLLAAGIGAACTAAGWVARRRWTRVGGAA